MFVLNLASFLFQFVVSSYPAVNKKTKQTKDQSKFYIPI